MRKEKRLETAVSGYCSLSKIIVAAGSLAVHGFGRQRSVHSSQCVAVSPRANTKACAGRVLWMHRYAALAMIAIDLRRCLPRMPERDQRLGAAACFVVRCDPGSPCTFILSRMTAQPNPFRLEHQSVLKHPATLIKRQSATTPPPSSISVERRDLSAVPVRGRGASGVGLTVGPLSDLSSTAGHPR